MSRPRPPFRLLLALLLLLLLGALASPALVRGYWSYRASNPVRRGLARATQLGCFACHGPQGATGVPDPGLGGEPVPAWGGMVWMMYVSSDAEIREFILDGVSRKRAASETARAERARAAIRMPAFRDRLRGGDLDDLVAAFRALSGMGRPASGTAAGRGYEVASARRCFACHGPAGAGGAPNPGSLAGFIPGWYGPDFRDLVRGRDEFDAWVREGAIPRLSGSRVARYFLERQKLRMPAYRAIDAADLDALWAYVQWLGEGGAAAASS